MTSLLYLLTSHAAVVLTWMILGSAIAGLGLLYRRCFTRGALNAQELLTAFWTGVALVLLLLQVWHLVLPINAAALVTVLALGAAGLMSERRALQSWVGGRPWSGHRLALSLSCAMIAWTANRSIGSIELYDTGMYHIPVVEWSKAYAIVPGLANLHGRLAFNSASLLYAAMIDHGVWSGRSFHVANSLLLVLFGLSAALAWTRLVVARVRPQLADVFDAFLIVFVVGLLIAGKLSSLETDLPVSLMLLAAGSRIHRSLTDSGGTEEIRRSDFAAVALLLGAAVCVKLSAVALAGTLFAVALFTYWPQLKRARTATAGSILIPVVMGLVWMVRGVVLSGFPVYPSTVLAVSVPWRVPTQQAVAEAAWIRMQELTHDQIMAGYDWLIPWAIEIVTDFRFIVLVLLPAVVTVVLGAIVALRWQRRPESARHGRAVWTLFIPVVIGATFWFFAAPHARFGTGSMWLGAALTSTLWFSTLSDDDASRRRQIARLVGVLAGVSILAFVALAVFKPDDARSRHGNHGELFGGLVILPGPDYGLHPAPAPSLVGYTTSSGLRLAVPKHTNQCWRGPLLCTPHPAPNLRLRNPANIAEGFVADGGVWLPLRWPNPWTPFLPWLACRRAGGVLPPGVARDRACIAQTAQMPTDTLDRVTTPFSGDDPTVQRRKSRVAPTR